MEGVGARLGRSSTRYGPTTVFTGPVRKWKKRWVTVPPPSSAATNPSRPIPGGANSNNGNNGSHLLLYKWTPLSDGNGGSKDGPAAATEEPPKKKFRYVPIVVLEEQNNEDEKAEYETKENDTPSAAGPSSETKITEEFDSKPDVNDLPMEDSQAFEKAENVPRELNETSVDLSQGLNDHGGDEDSN